MQYPLSRRTFLKTSAALGAGMLINHANASGRRWRTPDEGAPHACTWMAWPSVESIYEDAAYFENVQQALGQLAAAISRFEPVRMAAPREQHDRARELCGPAVELVPIPCEDMWMRDSGPVFVRFETGDLGVVNLHFNGWGDKQTPRSYDERIAGAVAEHLGFPVIDNPLPLVGEGGGLEFDGDGTLLLTDSCWLNDNRNPGIDRKTMTAELKRLFGLEKVIWLPGVRDQDITDGHIDGAMRFVRPGLVMTGGLPGDDSDWGLALAEGREILKRETDARGRAFELVDIPSASEPANPSEWLFTGYANYYLANGALFTGVFGDKQADAFAIDTLGKLFPERKIVPLSLDAIYESGGGIHCVTQQQPA
ncbi:MAG: agmatine deiminase family protein [Pseudomonadota bacterium]